VKLKPMEVMPILRLKEYKRFIIIVKNDREGREISARQTHSTFAAQPNCKGVFLLAHWHSLSSLCCRLCRLSA